MNAEIEDAIKIFRIFNFRDLVQTLVSSKLRFSQSIIFRDPNEGFGYLASQASSGFFDDSQVKFGGEVHQVHRRGTYLSCWTKDSGNPAIWQSYSQDGLGIMAQTTIGKLKQAVNSHTSENRFELWPTLKPNDPRDLVFLSGVNHVQYVDIEQEKQKLEITILERKKESEKTFNSLMNDELDLSSEGTQKYGLNKVKKS